MNSKIEITDMAEVCKLLGNETRLRIMSLIQSKTCCVCELVEVLEMTQPAISQHLRRLRDAKVVREERRGQWNYYSLNKVSSNYSFIEQMLKFAPMQKDLLEKLNKVQEKC